MKIRQYSKETAAALKGCPRLSEITGGRIFPIVAPRGTSSFPVVTYRQAGRKDEGTKDGSEGETKRVEVSIFARSYETLVETADAVESALQEYDGDISFYTDDYAEDFDVNSEIYFSVFSFLVE